MRPKPRRAGKRKHWGRYESGTYLHRYRLCLVCGQWRRNTMLVPKYSKPLIHKGGKP